MEARRVSPGASRLGTAARVLLLAASVVESGAAFAAEPALGTLTVLGKTTSLRHVVATRETDPEASDRIWLVLLVTDRAVPPAERAPGRLRALAAAGKVTGVRVSWAEGYDRVDAVPYHGDLQVSGMRGPERPTLDLGAYDEKSISAEIASKMLGQDWHFRVRVETVVVTAGPYESEPEASVASRDDGAGASPEKARKLELGALGYEYTEEGFFRAVKDGVVPAVKLFLELGISQDATEEPTGHVLVTAAMFCGNEPKAVRGEIVEALLAGGSNPKAEDSNGASALLWAAESCPLETVKALIRAGADVNAKAKGGGTALMMAEVFERDDVAKALRAAGARK